MKYLKTIILLLCFTNQSQAQKTIYTSQSFLLQIDKNEKFTFYAKELSLELTVSGTAIIQNDSLILTTHKVDGESAIFAIFIMHSNQLSTIFKQKEFYNNIPDNYYLLKKTHSNGSIAQENYWDSFEKGQYEKFEFDENKNILAKQNYTHFKLDGKQLIFKGDKASTISFELNYKNGQLHGKSFYYKKLEEDANKVIIQKIEKYKKGHLKKTKKPAKPQVFYTNHF